MTGTSVDSGTGGGVVVPRRSARRRNAARWLAAPVAASTIIGGVLLSQAADASPTLPARTAEQLLVDLQTAEPVAFSGVVTDSIDLGLPEVSATDGLSGDHTWRVWSDGADRSRLALVAGSKETNLVRNGRDVWLWSSAEQTATHHVMRPGEGAPGSGSGFGAKRPGAPIAGDAANLPTTPEDAARLALDSLDPTTEVTTAGTGSVAGRAAYELVLTPRDSATRVARVTLSIDAERHVPLRVQVASTKTGANAIDIGFSSITFETPDAGVFAFTPPPGATVVESDRTGHGRSAHGAPGNGDPAPTGDDALAEPVVVGQGWSAVAAGYLPQKVAADASPEGAGEHTSRGAEHGDSASDAQGMLDAMPSVSGAWGTGRVVDGPLFSAVITDDGRYAIGAVSPDSLYGALPAPR